MLFQIEDLEKSGAPISFLKKGEVKVMVGPCSSSFFSGQKIPLDGRNYVCAGIIIFRNGEKYQANFEINTHTFDFLERDSVYVFIEQYETWYSIDDEELWKLLGISKDEGLPYKWLPDRPLDYYDLGPYPMKW
jgi:hypothetical protein